MFKNVASQKFRVFAFDATTNLPKTGDAANLTAYISKDYGAVTVLGDTSATEEDSTNAKGWYLFDATQAETNFDVGNLTAKSSTANIVVIGERISTVPAKFTTMVIDAAGLVDANTVKIGPTGAGTAQTARDVGASVLLSSGTGAGQLSLSSGLVTLAAVTHTGAVIPTVTNLTNAPTAGDLTATMKASLATAVWTDTTAGDFTTALSVGKSIMNGVALGTGLTIASVSGSVGSVTGAVGSVTGSVGSVTGLTASNLDVAVSTRMATYTQPTGFLAATFPTTVASTTNITGGTITTVTNVTNDVGITQAGADKVWSTAARSLTVTTGFRLSSVGVDDIVRTGLTEGYAADGATFTLEQGMYMLWSALQEFSIAGTTITGKKLDGSTTSMTWTLDSSTAPTSRTRAT